MRKRDAAAVVLAAGRGTRMKSVVPKVLHPLAGLPLIRHVMAAVMGLKPRRTVVVVAPGMEDVAEAVAPVPTAVQRRPLGTADAVRAARSALDGFAGDVLVVSGDAPLVTTETLRRLLAARRAPEDPAAAVLGMVTGEAGEYGKLVLDEEEGLARIVEHRDATETERGTRLCNAGVYAFDGERLFGYLKRIGRDNAKGEYYLTDAIGIARADGARVSVVLADEEEGIGINGRADLARAERIMQRRLRSRALEGGATLLDPGSVFFSFDTRLGRDVTVGPNVFFGPGVTVADGAEIRANCTLEGATVGAYAVVGPFARLRPGAVVGPRAHVGNFVEVKEATIGAGAKINHLSYIGDARVGAGANVGAGTITCNYDGYAKAETVIGKGAFIGSNTALVAPVVVGDGAIVGAGSVITRDVAPDALALTRPAQEERRGWASAFRKRKGRAIARDEAGAQRRVTGPRSGRAGESPAGGPERRAKPARRRGAPKPGGDRGGKGRRA